LKRAATEGLALLEQIRRSIPAAPGRPGPHHTQCDTDPGGIVASRTRRLRR